MKKFLITMAVAGVTSLMADGATVFGKCVACHGAKAEKSALNKSAIVQGQDAAKIIESLNGYKAGTLNKNGMGALMKGQVATLSNDDIKAVAEYIATLK